MLCDASPRSYPDIRLGRYIFKKFFDGSSTAWFASNSTMKTNCHHLRLSFAPLFVKDVKSCLEVLSEVLSSAEARSCMKLHIIAVITRKYTLLKWLHMKSLCMIIRLPIRYHKHAFRIRRVFLGRDIHPEGYVVRVRVTLV